MELLFLLLPGSVPHVIEALPLPPPSLSSTSLSRLHHFRRVAIPDLGLDFIPHQSRTSSLSSTRFELSVGKPSRTYGSISFSPSMSCVSLATLPARTRGPPLTRDDPPFSKESIAKQYIFYPWMTLSLFTQLCSLRH